MAAPGGFEKGVGLFRHGPLDRSTVDAWAIVAELAELRHAQGCAFAKVHRSWWVSRRVVSDVHLGGRGGSLTLRNGIQVPIARSALGAIRAAGWS